MKEQTSENFQSEIHVRDYQKQFEQHKIDANNFMLTDGRQKEFLNGNWHFIADQYACTLRGEWFKEQKFDEHGQNRPYDFDFDYWQETKVPSCWNMQSSELFYYESLGVYMRTFSYKPSYKGEYVHLCFDGVSYRCFVFLNGKCIGMHDGGSTPFSINITQYVKKENRLIVAVDGSRSADRIPMDNTDWFNYSGIYRDVYLVRTPPVYIRDWFVRLVPDGTYQNIEADIQIGGIANILENPAETTIRLQISELGIDRYETIQNGNVHMKLDAKIELWSPENPKLYEVIISYISGNKTIDIVTDTIGFREFCVKNEKLYLNGKAVFLKGICLHEDHIDLGKGTNETVIHENLRHLKDLHGSFLRLAHYPHTPLFSKIADKEGILLWEEIPVYWAVNFNSKQTFADAKNQLTELILRDKNRASVIIWSVGNENPDTDERYTFMKDLAIAAKKLDSTRLVSAACLVNLVQLKIEDRFAKELDIIGLNEYYGWYDQDFSKLSTLLKNSNPDKPVIITEFGAGAEAGFHGTKETMWSEEFQAELYKKQLDLIARSPFIQGITPWILIDFRAARRLNRRQRGFNRKGLIDSDRKTRKLAFYILSEFYRTHKQ